MPQITKITEDQLQDAVPQSITPRVTRITEDELRDSSIVSDGFGLQDFFQDVKKKAIGDENEDFTLKDYIDVGFEGSIAGMLIRGEAPEKPMPKDPSILGQVTTGVVQEALDLPATITGFAAGATIGGPIGAFAGAFGLPMGIRSAMIKAYESGEVNTFKDFWDIASAFAIDGAKGGIIGGTTGAVGGKVAKMTAPSALGLVAKGLSPKKAAMIVGGLTGGSELATMISVSAALEGRIPDKGEFINGAASLLGIKGAATITKKAGSLTTDIRKTISKVYVKTDVRPNALVKDSRRFPDVKEDIMGGVEKPRRYPLTNDQLKVRSMIVEKPKNKEGLDFVSIAIDKLAPIKRAIKEVKDLKVVEENSNAYTKLRLLAGHTSKVEDIINNGPTDFNKRDVRTAKGLRAIIEPIKDQVDGLTEYLVSRRVIELTDRKIKTGVDVKAAKNIVSTALENIKVAAKEIDQLQGAILKYYKDSGMLSEKEYTRIKNKNKSYVPFERLIETTGKKGGTTGKRLKAITGSREKIINPLETIAENIDSMVRAADKNDALLKLVDELSDTGYVEKVSSRSKKIDNSIEIYRDGKKENWTAPEDIMKAIDSLSPDEIGLTIKVLSFPARIKRIGITNAVTFGLTSFLRGEIVTSINSINRYIPLVDGTIGLAGLIGAKQGLKNKAAGKKLTKSQQKYVKIYTEFAQEGGLGSALIDLDKKYLKTGIQKELLNSKTRNQVGPSTQEAVSSIAKVITKLPENALGVLENIALTIENAPRFREFMLSRKSGKPVDVAALSGREVAVDFAKGGTSRLVRDIRLLNAFTGARINGGDKLLRQLKNKPLQTSARAAGFIVVPEALTHILNHYEENEKGEWVLANWYKDLKDYQRDLFNPIKIGEGDNATIMRIPRAWDYGIMYGRSTQLFIDYLYEKDKKVFGELAGAMRDNFGGGILEAVIPDAFSPIIEAGINKSLFFNSPIIPLSRENMVSEMQYTPYTTELAKAISKPISQIGSSFNPDFRQNRFISPAAIENYIRGWTGVLGISALKTLDDALKSAGIVDSPPKKSPSISDILGITGDFDGDIRAIDIPIVRAFFIRNPSLNAQPIADFYKMDRRNRGFRKSIKELAKTNPEAALELRNEAIALNGFVDISNAKKFVSNAMATIRKINLVPDSKMPPIERRQRIDEITIELIEYTRSINKMIEKENTLLKKRLRELK